MLYMYIRMQAFKYVHPYTCIYQCRTMWAAEGAFSCSALGADLSMRCGCFGLSKYNRGQKVGIWLSLTPKASEGKPA